MPSNARDDSGQTVSLNRVHDNIARFDRKRSFLPPASGHARAAARGRRLHYRGRRDGESLAPTTLQDHGIPRGQRENSHETVILSGAPHRLSRDTAFVARSRRACPERSRGNPGGAYLTHPAWSCSTTEAREQDLPQYALDSHGYIFFMHCNISHPSGVARC